jgi:outer membrane protein, multidrug efflux system
VLVKTLVSATGLPEPQVRTLLGEQAEAMPNPAEYSLDALPASVIEQRPDVISAERQVASTLAKIGVAEANRWPTFTITGSISAATTAGLATTPWSLVPAISLPLFQGGSLTAKVASARADYDSAVASYTSTVRNAVFEVEQALVNLDSAALRERDAQTSAEQYRQYVAASEVSWRSGLGSLQDLETARRSYLSAELSRIELQQTRVTQWITLYKAMGGGWQGALASGEKS